MIVHTLPAEFPGAGWVTFARFHAVGTEIEMTFRATGEGSRDRPLARKALPVEVWSHHYYVVFYFIKADLLFRLQPSVLGLRFFLPFLIVPSLLVAFPFFGFHPFLLICFLPSSLGFQLRLLFWLILVPSCVSTTFVR